MINYKRISGQRGTLLVEAIAMLGLIALVTPTLYKKSAERLQEIQDINTASQARTMYSIIETFMKTNYGLLLDATSSAAGQTVVVGYSDGGSSCADNLGAPCFEKGYSSFVPFGYTPGELKNYSAPNVYIHRDNDSLVSYIVFPAISSTEIGKKRAARVASLVGANGGVVSRPFSSGSGASSEIYGTGGAWYLDYDMLGEIKMDDELVENSLVVTSPEPVNMSNMDSEKFLYRVPSDDADGYFHNTMVMDLYLGGHEETKTNWQSRSHEYYSIFNVRKLTLNTNCQHNRDVEHSSITGTEENYCNPNVADLYIGKPNGRFLDTHSWDQGIEGNTGAAWIYGNLAALNENFRLFHDAGSSDVDIDRERGRDVMEFVRRLNEEGGGTSEFSVFRVENSGASSDATVTDSGARISLMNDFLQVFENGSGSSESSSYELTLGYSSYSDSFIRASMEGDAQVLRLSSPKDVASADTSSMVTMINHGGGIVYINGGASSDVQMDTVINDMGGKLTAGKSGSWIDAANSGNSAVVYILDGGDAADDVTDRREFFVGSKNGEFDNATMIYGNSSRVSLRGGKVRVHNQTIADSSAVGGIRMLQDIYNDNNLIPNELSGETAILSRYTDILGTTHMGTNSIEQSSSANEGDILYKRPDWTLTVAGNAWIDDLLYANRAWLKEAGVKELHAGFPSFAAYQNNPHTGWLNVYDDRFVVRDSSRAGAANGADDSSNVMIYADSSEIVLRDLQGTSLLMAQNTARLGNEANYLYVDSPENENHAINVVGSTLASVYTTDSTTTGVVNLQKDALQLFGQPEGAESYGNRIEARAQEFMIQTTGDTQNSSTAQFYATEDEIRTRYVDFSVESDDSSAIFKVMPNVGAGSSDANVQVHGTLHVNNNEVIHVASDESNRAGEEGEERAMLEVDPEYVQIWARNGDTYASRSAAPENDYYAMLKVNPSDINGGSSSVDDTVNASVYIRRGAIELEPSRAGVFGAESNIAADQGVGYIKANRFVSDSDERLPGTTSVGSSPQEGRTETGAYDQYMVNPAYTSVMHDIKLTTRGGARLSDALPDFVLKGVYNLVNNCAEGTSSGKCSNTGMDSWASPYIGLVPYASCPPGYRNMATVVPISFNIGQAGQLVEASKLGISGAGGNGWVVNPHPRQAQVVSNAGDGILYPTFGKVEGYNAYSLAQVEGGFATEFASVSQKRPEGWFSGFKAKYDDATHESTVSEMETITGANNPYDNFQPWKFAESGNDWKVVAEPLYFQQNTWLKTSVVPDDDGWNAFMGFLYDTSVWGGTEDSNIRSNYNEQGYNDEGNAPASLSGYAWNVFPVPTNTIEGHATVYCYFDRSNFESWGNLIDQRDARNLLRDGGQFERNVKDTDYKERLNDPSLKYDDPW